MPLDLSKLVTKMEPAHMNEARELWEPINGEEIRRVNFFTFLAPSAKHHGHFHKKSSETFLVTRGRITKLVIEDPATRDRVVFEDLEKGTKIVLPPNIAHAFLWEPGSEAIAMCSGAFDEGDKDLNPYELVMGDGRELSR